MQTGDNPIHPFALSLPKGESIFVWASTGQPEWWELFSVALKLL